MNVERRRFGRPQNEHMLNRGQMDVELSAHRQANEDNIKCIRHLIRHNLKREDDLGRGLAIDKHSYPDRSMHLLYARKWDYLRLERQHMPRNISRSKVCLLVVSAPPVERSELKWR